MARPRVSLGRAYAGFSPAISLPLGAFTTKPSPEGHGMGDKGAGDT